MCAVVLAVGRDSSKFIALACVNIVISANAGGAFSPFGDITTLMIWQKGIVPFQSFLLLFVPSLVNSLVSAAIMYFFYRMLCQKALMRSLRCGVARVA